MTADRRPSDYAVGYGKPPVETRFQPGRSGNPNGRPKGARSLDALLAAELAATVTITEQGRRRQITKAALIVKQLVNKAAAGDLKTVMAVLKAMQAAPSDPEAAAPAPLTEAEREIMKRARSQLRGGTSNKDDGDA